MLCWEKVLQNKQVIYSRRIKVFLSSSMQNEIFMEQRCAVLSYFEREPFYECFAIEGVASPDPVKKRYSDEVVRNDLIILILQKERRDGVAEEFDIARRSNKRIFAFLHDGNRTPELEELIAEVRGV